MPGDNGNDVISNKEKNCRGMTFREKTKKSLSMNREAFIRRAIRYSEQTISRFVNLGWIKNFGDIFRLKDHIEEISALEGFGAKSASNINASLEKSASVSGRKFLYALNIPLIGADVAGRLLDSYPLDEVTLVLLELNTGSGATLPHKHQSHLKATPEQDS